MNLTTAQAQSLTFLGLGIAVVLLTSLLKRERWSKKTKNAVALVLSTLTGLVSSYFQKHGTADLIDVTKHSAYLYSLSQLLYTYALGNTSVNQWLTDFSLVPGSKTVEDTPSD